MLKATKVVSLNSDTQAAQALILDDLSLSGYCLFVILHTECEDAFTRARQALSNAETAFFSSQSVLPNRLDEVMTNITDLLADTQNLQVLLAGTSKHPNSGQV